MTTATAISVRPATTADANQVASILAAGFANDPIFAWVLPDPKTRAWYTRAAFDVFAPMGIAAGTVEMTSDGTSCSLWLSVDPAEDSEDAEFGAKLMAAVGPHGDRFGIISGLMDAAHPHDRPHAYLNFLATLPGYQGQGIGRAVLDTCLADLDATGTPAYLEATTLRSAKLYESAGFRHLAQTIDLPHGPSMYPMWREPAAR